MIEIEIHARPNAAKNHVGGEHDGRLRVSVTAAPDKGKANKAIQKLLAKTLSIAPSAIELIGGATSRKKRFRIDVSSEVERRLKTELERVRSL
ncbi:DUF167 domain-containing protein [Roseiconus lacunae]|uniref:DUF167 domain-containing protein n=1 Tax=Roseiconus lacunae TaxID=2605694 RepID=UPI0011F17E2B|nr:DUF167 domain-containing protein [Roseiconus lacunae]